MNRKLIILLGVIIVLIAAYFFAKNRNAKRESGFDENEKDLFSTSDPFGEENPECPEGQVWMDTLPGCVDA